MKDLIVKRPEDIEEQVVIASDKVVKYVHALEHAAKQVHVKDEDSQKYADELYKEIYKLEKDIDKQRKKLTQPIERFKKQIIAAAKGLIEKLSPARKRIGDSLSDYMDEQEIKRLAAESEAKKAEEERQRKIADAEKKAEEEDDFPDVVEDPKPTAIPAGPIVRSAAIKTRTIKELVILGDENAIPFQVTTPAGRKIQLWTLNENAVKDALDAGCEVPGAEYREKTITVAK